MSISKRLYELARANLNALLDKASERNDPGHRLGQFSDTELTAELERRRLELKRRDHVRGAKDSFADAEAAASAADPATGDRAERERLARERAERVKSAQQARAREQQEQAAQSRAKASGSSRERAGGGRASGSQRASGGASAAWGGWRGRGHRAKDGALAKHYAVLEVPVGSDFATIKAAYRKLMRKYHPDLHRNDPQKLQAASEVTVALTTAYNELEKALMGGPNR